MAQLTKQALLVENNTSFPNNNTGAITPTILRNFNTDMIDSTVNQEAYTTASALVDGRLDSLENFTGSALISASVDGATITFEKGDGSTFDLAITASVGSVDWDNITDKPSGLVSGSEQVVSILTSVNAYTSSADAKFATIGTQSGSWGGGGDVTALNAFTASQETKNTTLASYTGSVDTKFTTIGSQSGSWENVPLTSLNAFTSSQETKNTTLGGVTASLQQQLTNIGSQSGSWVTESETGSFARVDVSNTFTTSQTIQGGLNVTGTITANEIHTIIESSSVIYSSGSNILGDAADDTQTLNGSVNVVNQLTASGLHYPTADNGAKSFIQTDGNGNLSLQYVDAVFETVRNMSGIALSKGTPIYISGSTGDNGNAYVADAADASKMPAMYIVGEDLAIGATGIALCHGLIEGVNTTGYTAGTIIYVAEGGGWTSSRPSGSASVVQVLGVVQFEGVGGQGVVVNQLEATLPNLQTGYAWVGNGGNQPTATPTSSFASLTDLSSLNAFTASQEVLNAQFADTGSNAFIGNQTITGTSKQTFNEPGDNQEVQVVKVNSFTDSNGYSLANNTWGWYHYNSEGHEGFASQLYTADYAYGSAFFHDPEKWEYILFPSGAAYDTNKFGLYDVGGTQTKFVVQTDNIELTGSVKLTPASVSTNAQYPLTFISGTTISKDSVDTLVYNPFTNQLLLSASTGTANVSPNAITFTSGSGAYGTYASTVSKVQIQSSVEGGGVIGISGNPSKIGAPSLTNSTKPGIIALSSSAQPYVAIELQNSSSFTDGRVTFPRNVAMLQNLEITGSLTSSLQQGYVWVGDSNGKTTTVATSSFGGGGTTDITALNAFTASQEVLNAKTAYTGSNTFTGNQTINANLVANKVSAWNFDSIFLGSQLGGTTANGTFFGYGSTDYQFIVGAYAGGFDSELKITANSSGIEFGDFNGSSYPSWLKLNPNTGANSAPIFTRGLVVTGSTDLSSTLTASLQQGYVWVGDANGRTTTVPTSSFGGGGAAFPYSGNAVITGSLGISGSMFGGVVSLTVTSNTASIDFSAGNMFLLTLPSGSTTYFEPTNIRQGQTINIQLTQQTPGTGSVSFAPSIKFAGGNDYQATATGSAIDLVSLVSLDGTNVLATSIKNFL
jgi:hypothetical protein